MQAKETVLQNINSYKRKYYKGLLLRGSLKSAIILIVSFAILALLEYSFWFDTPIRTVIVILFLIGSLLILYKNIVVPLLYLLGKAHGISDQKAAQSIGIQLEFIGDKILNFIQLNNSKGNSSLASASLNQRAEEVSSYNLSSAINIKDYSKVWPYLVIILSAILILSAINSKLFIDSSQRIANFNQVYSPPQLFSFKIDNAELNAFRGESYVLTAHTAGEITPNQAYIVIDGRRIKMRSSQASIFSYEFSSPQNNESFYLESAGVRSDEYELNVVAKATLKSFSTRLVYPSYLGKSQEVLNAVGNLTVPEGTEINWNINTAYTDSVTLHFFKDDTLINAENTSVDEFQLSRIFNVNDQYKIIYKNEDNTENKGIIYNVEVIADNYPSISYNAYEDTVLYQFVALDGSLKDDYGITALKLHYRTSQSSGYQSLNIPIRYSNVSDFYYNWSIDSLLGVSNSELSYYLEVWDNDGINGRKSTKTKEVKLTLPDSKTISDQIEQGERQAQSDVNESLQDAQSLKEELESAKEELKGQNELTWQQENKLKEIIKKKEAITEAIEKLQELNKKNNLQKDRFTKQQENIKKKAEQLQKLMDELLDEETKGLYEELQKLLEEQKDINQIQEKVSQLDNKEQNLEKELERALELMKRIQLEQKIEETKQATEELAQNQEQLSEGTQDKSNQISNIQDQQEEIENKLHEIEKELDEIKEQNQELKNPESLPDMEEALKEIKQTQKDIQEELENGKRKKGSQQQQKAADQMQKLAEQMNQMQSSMQMQMMQENLDHLRHIVHSLLKLSFDQESLMTDFRTIDQSDPRFVELSQDQIKLKDDAKILEDSLLSLASRVFQISSFVTREVSAMNQAMDESSEAIKERLKGQAVSKQQFAMTSMNNLALLLDDVLQQMQQQMADMMMSGKPQSGDDKGQKNQPGLSELQKSLNDKISELKKSGKSGRQLSEELAELAAEQEKLRETLENYQDRPDGIKEGNGSLSDIIEKMEETEVDLVNKNITQKTIERQQEILTRLLESEDALREQDQEEKREAESASDYEQYVPKAFDEYLKAKEKEIELLKTVPPRLYPHYKKEVDKYFDRANDED